MEMERTYQEHEKALIDKIEECQFVLGGLENNASFKKAMEVFENNKKNLDNAWQFISDPQKMMEARITKMALMSVLNVVDDYKADLKKAQDELEKLQRQDKEILKDYDPN